MAQIQSIDSKSSFIFVRDQNTQCSISPINNHDHAVLDIAFLLGCEKFVTGATHKSGNCLDLVFTNVPRIEVNVFPPVGFSDHSLCSCIVSTAILYFNSTKFFSSMLAYYKCYRFTKILLSIPVQYQTHLSVQNQFG